MKRKIIYTKCLVLALILILSAQTGLAADWYLRGAVGFEQSLKANFFDTDCASSDPANLFGCVNGSDGQAIGAYGDFGSFPLAEIAAGRRIFSWLRADLSLAYRFHMNYDANANFLNVGSSQPVSAKADSLSGMMNVFVDINGLTGGRKFWRFQPYIGGGAGLSQNRIGQMTFLFPENPRTHKLSIIPSGDKTDFAFMLAVGTGIVLTQRLSLDVAYRFFDLGRVETNPGLMTMDIRPTGISVGGIETRLRSHGLTVGLRCDF